MESEKKTQKPSRSGKVTLNHRVNKSVVDSIDTKYKELEEYCIKNDLDNTINKGVFVSIVIRESAVMTMAPEEILNKVR